MRSYTTFSILLRSMSLLMLLCTYTVYAQFTTPTVNGTIGDNEYGDHAMGKNRQISNSVEWYMTWDNEAMYIGISNASIGQGAIVYIDKNPLTPINGGGNPDGSISGSIVYDGVGFSNLPFRADIVLFFKDDYREYRLADGNNGWSLAYSPFGTYSNSGLVREIKIPWTIINGVSGRPQSFAWMGVISNNSNDAYADVPPEASIEYSAGNRPVRYYIINSTENNTSVKPFARNNYIFNSNTSISDFGPLSVYDFTMNSTGKSISRSNGEWSITGNMLVHDGTVSFGSIVDGCQVKGDVVVSSAGTLTLSTAIGGDLTVSGNYTVNGTLNKNQRAVTFTGNGNSTISGTSVPLYFDYLAINKTSGDVVLNNNITLYKTAQFTSGDLNLNGNTLTLSGIDALLSETAGNTVKGETGNVTYTRDINAPSALTPGGLGVTFTSVANFGSTTITRTHNRASGNGNDGAYRIYRIEPATNTGLNATAVFKYDETELNGIDEANLRLFKSSDAVNWALYPSVNDAAANTLTATGIDGFSYWAFGDVNSPLPVELSTFSSSVSGQAVNLSWSTATEIDNYGFEVQKSENQSDWNTIGFVHGSGNSNSNKQYAYTDQQAGTGTIYYRLKQIDNAGSFRVYDPIAVEVEIPKDFTLSQNYPNPFNPATTINYTLPTAGSVTLQVYSMNGELVQTLVQKYQVAGTYTVAFDASRLASGTYIYRLIATDAAGKNFTDTKKMLLMK